MPLNKRLKGSKITNLLSQMSLVKWSILNPSNATIRDEFVI